MCSSLKRRVQGRCVGSRRTTTWSTGGTSACDESHCLFLEYGFTKLTVVRKRRRYYYSSLYPPSSVGLNIVTTIFLLSRIC